MRLHQLEIDLVFPAETLGTTSWFPALHQQDSVVTSSLGEDNRPYFMQWAFVWDLDCVLFFAPRRLGGCPYSNELLIPTFFCFQLLLPSLYLHLPPKFPYPGVEVNEGPQNLGKDDSLHSSSAPSLTFHDCEQKEPLCTSPFSFFHGTLQARILEWVAMPSSRGSSQPRDQSCLSYVSCTDRQVLYH